MLLSTLIRNVGAATAATAVVVGCVGLASVAGAADRWAKALGGSGQDELTTIQRTSDGGYIIAGNTSSFGAGNTDGWPIKLSSAGAVEWQRTYGGSARDNFTSVREVPAGGYVAVGHSLTFGGTSLAFWVVRVDATGSEVWAKSGGGAADNLAYSIEPLGDGGFVLAGVTYSAGAGGADVLLTKLDSSGSVVWQKIYGTPGDDYAFDVAPTPDGYVLVGTSNAVSNPGDALVLKVDQSGNELWDIRIVGMWPQSAYARLSSVIRAADGNYVAVGYIQANGDTDAWAVSLSPINGLPLGGRWIAGGSGWDELTDVQQTAGGDFVMTGYTSSAGAGNYDAWIVNVHSSFLTLTANVTYGGTATDWLLSGCQAADGDYVFAGGSGGAEGLLVKAAQTDLKVSGCSLVEAWASNLDLTAGWGGNGGFSFAIADPGMLFTAANTQIATTAAQFTTLCPGGPAITSIKSKTSKPGGKATIRGTGFSTTLKKNTVYFGSRKAKISKAKTSSLKVTIPTNVSKGTVSVSVVVDGAKSNSFPFTVK